MLQRSKRVLSEILDASISGPETRWQLCSLCTWQQNGGTREIIWERRYSDCSWLRGSTRSVSHSAQMWLLASVLKGTLQNERKKKKNFLSSLMGSLYRRFECQSDNQRWQCNSTTSLVEKKKCGQLLLTFLEFVPLSFIYARLHPQNRHALLTVYWSNLFVSLAKKVWDFLILKLVRGNTN